MTIASDLLHRHFQTLVDDNAHWQTLIADDLVWELPYAPAIGHPARLSGREEVVHHALRIILHSLSSPVHHGLAMTTDRPLLRRDLTDPRS